jgi:hypothetical protein
LKLALG